MVAVITKDERKKFKPFLYIIENKNQYTDSKNDPDPMGWVDPLDLAKPSKDDLLTNFNLLRAHIEKLYGFDERKKDKVLKRATVFQKRLEQYFNYQSQYEAFKSSASSCRQKRPESASSPKTVGVDSNGQIPPPTAPRKPKRTSVDATNNRKNELLSERKREQGEFKIDNIDYDVRVFALLSEDLQYIKIAFREAGTKDKGQYLPTCSTLLHLAVHTQNIDVIKFVLSFLHHKDRKEINNQNIHGDTVAHLCAKTSFNSASKKVEILALLFSKGVDRNITNRHDLKTWDILNEQERRLLEMQPNKKTKSLLQLKEQSEKNGEGAQIPLAASPNPPLDLGNRRQSLPTLLGKMKARSKSKEKITGVSKSSNPKEECTTSTNQSTESINNEEKTVTKKFQRKKSKDTIFSALFDSDSHHQKVIPKTDSKKKRSQEKISGNFTSSSSSPLASEHETDEDVLSLSRNGKKSAEDFSACSPSIEKQHAVGAQ